ncbi:MAG: bifunctional oligoribonuclease/PAP phosphatase NrnA [Clostridia bacterium]|nr:bifunctional oligoribonuclease/PAP phosphatase NrnA [Clostridia bacterium]
MKTAKELAQEFIGLKSVLIFCHTRPDGDTLGSAMALCTALRKKQIECDIVCDGIVPEKYHFISLAKHILKPECVMKKYQAHIAVDVATENLLGTTWGIFTSSDKTFVVDHHASNERYAKVNFVATAPATAMIVCKIIENMGVEFDKDIANSILLGIVTDTALFLNNNVNEECFTISAKMLSYGANMDEIVTNLYKNQSKARAQLYAEVIGRTKFYLHDRLAVVVTTLSDLNKYNLQSDETEGFVDFPLSISGVEVAVSILQTKSELYRVSFRSKGRVNVNDVAQEFGGGGHKFASGCVVKGIFEEVIEKIIRAVDINLY